MTNETPLHAAEANGTTPAADKRALARDALRAQIEEIREEHTALEARLRAITPELRSYEKALALISDDPADQPKPSKPGPKVKVRAEPSKIGEDRLEVIKQAIRAIAEHRDEFRQVDVRERTGLSSSVTATAFEQLRQDNVIRFARKDGNNKFFRLANTEVTEAS
jgi:hypothetical protein